MGLAGSVLAVGSGRLHLGPFVGASVSKNHPAGDDNWWDRACTGDRMGPTACTLLVRLGSPSPDLGLCCGNDGFGPHLVVLRVLGPGLFQQALRPELGPKQSALDVYFSGGRLRRHCRWMVFLLSATAWLDSECRTEIGHVGLRAVCRSGIQHTSGSELHPRRCI